MIATSPVNDRRQWINNRKRLETLRFGKLSKHARANGYVTPLDYFLPSLTVALKMSGFYYIGKKNARKVDIKEYELVFPDLPEAFEGYRILHLTDLHLDSMPGIEEVICQKLQQLHYDLCVMTGDYRWKSMGEYDDAVISPLRDIIGCLRAEDGVFATLGNHDTYQIVDLLEDMGVRVLTNESVYLYRQGGTLLLTGLDDPHQYFTYQATRALQTEDSDFKLALIHSPELYKEASSHGYDLYLCGHTHAGQICLPTGIPLITHLKKGKQLYYGLWKEGEMVGYTSAGCGVSGIPVRFNSRSEIALFTLRSR